MRWTAPHRYPDIRRTIDKYGLYNRTLTLLRAKMSGAGSPCTYWKNDSLTIYGTYNPNLTRCYCWKKTEGTEIAVTQEQSSPTKDHFLCMGTGMLGGYQKYGYTEIVFSTPSTYTVSAAALTVGNDTNGQPDKFMLSGTTTSASIDTQNYTLTNFKDINHFIVKESTDTNANRIEYFYSIDNGSTWAQITMIAYTSTRLGNKQASGFTLPVGTTQIKFRATFKKKTATSTSPLLNSIRFRYRNQPTLVELDTRFDVEIPSFLTCREQVTTEMNETKEGLKTTRPMRWWVLPEAYVKNTDIIMFLQGVFRNEKYEVQNLVNHTHGPDLQVLHRSFESAFLRDRYDIIRIHDILI